MKDMGDVGDGKNCSDSGKGESLHTDSVVDDEYKKLVWIGNEQSPLARAWRRKQQMRQSGIIIMRTLPD